MYSPFVYRGSKQQKKSLLKVIGEGSVTIEPNLAQLTLGVLTEDPFLTHAQEQNAATMTKINEALHSIGIKNKDVQTIDYSVQPIYDFVDGKQMFRSYRVEHLIRVTIEQIENVGLVVDRAVSEGANRVLRLDFSVADLTSSEEKALSQAILNAHAKAEAIAKTLKVRLATIPTTVTEIPRQPNGAIPFETATLLKSSTSIQPGILEVRKTVSVKYDYV